MRVFRLPVYMYLGAAFFLLSGLILSAQGQDLKSSSVKIFSRILDEERTLSISLPPDYAVSLHSYPVLYVLDAEGSRTFSQSVATVENLHRQNRGPQMIIVGIWNTNRNRDMIPVSVSHRPGSGGADQFLAFLGKELIPHIRKTYRAQNLSILYGMSNSALFSVYALLEAPGTFHAYVASSPMIGHCPEFIENRAQSFVGKEAAPDRLLYMIYGSQDSPRVTDYVPDFFAYLKTDAPMDFLSELVILEGEGHVPQSSLARALQFVFQHLNETI